MPSPLTTSLAENAMLAMLMLAAMDALLPMDAADDASASFGIEQELDVLSLIPWL